MDEVGSEPCPLVTTFFSTVNGPGIQLLQYLDGASLCLLRRTCKTVFRFINGTGDEKEDRVHRLVVVPLFNAYTVRDKQSFMIDRYGRLTPVYSPMYMQPDTFTLPFVSRKAVFARLYCAAAAGRFMTRMPEKLRAAKSVCNCVCCGGSFDVHEITGWPARAVVVSTNAMTALHTDCFRVMTPIVRYERARQLLKKAKLAVLSSRARLPGTPAQFCTHSLHLDETKGRGYWLKRGRDDPTVSDAVNRRRAYQREWAKRKREEEPAMDLPE